MKKLLLILFYLPILGYGQINVGNNQTICLNDTVQIVATYAPGTSIGLTSSPILITECDLGSPDVVEIQNVSSNTVDVSSWRLIISNNYTDINTANPIEQVLSGNMIAGETKFWTDNSTNNYWGNNILWNPGAYPTFTTWIILLDDNNSVMDVFVGNWPVADIASSAIATSVGIISLAGHWNGGGINQATIGPTLQSFSRIGNEDHNDSTDFSIMATSSGITNIGLSLPFIGGGATWYDQNTGQIVGTGDTLNYSPTQSTYIVGEIIDTTGQAWTDTMYLEVLNTTISATGFSLCNGPVVLTAPNGFATYNWNGASTSQVLTVTTPGTYYVDYVSTSGMSCQSDSVTIYSNTIPISLSTPDSIFICQGDTVFINGPTGFSQYNWSTGATTSSITTTSTGNYTLTVIDGNGCTGTSNTTTVNISPQSISLSTTGYSLCNGPVTIDAGSGYSSYLWSNNSTNQAIVVNAANSYFVTVTYPTGCTAMSDTITIASATGQFYFTINTPGNDSLCQPNGQVILDAGNFATFNWNTGATTQQITVASLGVYYVNVTDSNGCQGVSNPPFEVFNAVNTSAITGTVNAAQFQTETYSVTQSSGSTYNWWMNGGNIQSGLGTNIVDVIWNVAGQESIYVLETDANGCVGDTVSLPVSIIVSSIEEMNSARKLNKITDVLGRKSKQKKNTPLFYKYDDGTVEKRITVE
jgi:hypothetical protein